MKKKTRRQKYFQPACYVLLFLAFVLGSIEGSSYFMNRAGLTRGIPVFLDLSDGAERAESGPRRSIEPRVRFTSKHLVVFGGGLAWGRNVNDWSTIPSRLAIQFSDRRVYNLALPNGKPSEQLKRVKSHALDAVLEPKGLAVYFVTDEDVLRTRLESSWIARAARELALHTQTGKLLGLSSPLGFGASDFEKTASLIEQTKNEYAASFPEGKFAVVFYPGASKNVHELGTILAAKGMHYFDYSNLTLPKRTSFYRLENYAAVAARLAYDLKAWTKVETKTR